ncbi:MAG: FKBP-type peptidyl-prolyl cis-trans isomerase [Magnetococcales bacterium]|nr:FKBP-type peptidyl-prolyl cis-trans isomerase [Magnetococcales bacterium]
MLKPETAVVSSNRTQSGGLSLRSCKNPVTRFRYLFAALVLVLCSPQQASAFFGGESEHASSRQLLAEKNKREGADFLAKNKQKEGIITTPSGLQYLIEKNADGPKPKSGEKVTVHYDGTFIDGRPFDSSRKRGQPATFPLDAVIPGWTEGLQLMPVGSRYTFYIPSDLAYGAQGAGRGLVPPHATLIFDVELLGIQ